MEEYNGWYNECRKVAMQRMAVVWCSMSGYNEDVCPPLTIQPQSHMILYDQCGYMQIILFWTCWCERWRDYISRFTTSNANCLPYWRGNVILLATSTQSIEVQRFTRVGITFSRMCIKSCGKELGKDKLERDERMGTPLMPSCLERSFCMLSLGETSTCDAWRINSTCVSWNGISKTWISW